MSDAAVAELFASQQPGERIAVAVVTTDLLVVRAAPRSPLRRTVAHERTVTVTSRLAGAEGRASATGTGPTELAEALAEARATRTPGAAQPRVSTADRGPDGPPATLPELRAQVDTVRREVAVVDEAVVTAGSTWRRTERWCAPGRFARSSSAEVQVHARSSRASLAGVQAARLAVSVAALDLPALVRDFRRAHHNLSASPADVTAVRWLLLSPLATARMLSRVVPAMRRAAATSHGGPVGPLASPAVTLVRAELGSTPSERVAGPFLLRDGMLATGADSVVRRDTARSDLDDDGPAAVWYLEPGTPDGRVDVRPPGPGVVVERVLGFRGGLDLYASRLQIEVEGMAVDDTGEVGSTTLVVTATVPELLRAVERVAGPPVPYRISGLYGGSWCLLVGLDARPA